MRPFQCIRVNQALKAEAEMRLLAEGSKRKSLPSEPFGPAPSPSVFDKRGYMTELQAKADAARKEFEVAIKVNTRHIYIFKK